MPKQIYAIRLRAEEHQPLRTYVNRGQRSARSITRARILLLADEQWSDDEITTLLGINRTTVHRVRKSYCERGLLHALQEKDRSGASSKINGRVEATLTMLACSNPPTGSSRWTLELLADTLVELAVVESLSLESVRTTLKKTNSNLGE
ncbi:MAG: helix-turn-helix domain-containing protein [Candidatus Entotheonellia bacterium]